jgi:hypothetical protein
MDINRNNYESFFMDYLDGRMSPDQVVKLMSFLKENPDLKTELKEFEEIKIEPGEISFSSKTSLKKRFVVSDTNFNDLCVASLEGDLTEEEERLFNNYLKNNPSGAKEFKLYKKTRLIPENIIFEDKSILKKKSVIRIPALRVWGYISAAASITIFVTLYFFAWQPANTEKSQFAEKQSDTTSIEIRAQENEFIRDDEIDNLNLKKKPETKLPVKKIIKSPVTEHLIYNKPLESDTSVKHDTKKIHLEKVTRKEINPLPEKPILATLVIIRDFEVIETSRYNLTLSQKVIRTFKKEVLKEKESMINPDMFTLWDIADAGIIGINKIIGWEMEFDKEYNDDGELTAFAFDSNTISLYHTMNK